MKIAFKKKILKNFRVSVILIKTEAEQQKRNNNKNEPVMFNFMNTHVQTILNL